MMNKRFASAALSAVMALSLAVPAFAENQAATGENQETKIPVTVSATATIFDVTVPTGFPITIDPATGETTGATNAEITNNSAGAVKVSKIEVENAGAWNLAAYDTDMSKEKVDSHKIGIQVTPKGGANATAGGTALNTTNDNATKQTLLDAAGATADEWVMNGKGVTDGSDKLTVDYNVKVSPVSQTITNEQAASIIITVAWNK